MGGFRFGTAFEVDGERCDAWLWTPVEGDDPPVVVMAPAFAADRRWRLPAFARRFAEAGLAVMLFDHRGAGESEGERGLFAPKRQVADWRAAVEHAGALDRTGDRLALWGTGYGAGHALTVAAERPVDALALQTPFLDGRAAAWLRARQAGAKWLAWGALAGLRDRLGALARRSPHLVPAVGAPGERAALTAPSAKAGYELLVPEGDEWENRVAARTVLSVPFYRPLARADGVDCPTLVVQATGDDVVPAGPVDDLLDRVDDVERVRYRVGHFAPYAELFERVAGREAAFLSRHLLDEGWEREHETSAAPVEQSDRST